jgi:hypothetical protein
MHEIISARGESPDGSLSAWQADDYFTKNGMMGDRGAGAAMRSEI